jgi:6-phosphogluconolactonase (cycloisomerase 2 family)
VFAFNNSTGAVTQISGSPFSIAPHTHVEAMAATPATAFVYTADWSDKVIQVFRADPSTGALTQTMTVSTPELQLPVNMVVDPAGKFLFVDDLNGFQVAVYTINSDGSLTPVPGSPFKASAALTQITIDSATKLLYASDDNTVFGFTIAAGGALTQVPNSPVTVRAPFFNPDKGPTNVGVAVDPAGKFLFVGDTTSQNTWVYAIASDGSLSLITGSPFSTPGNAGVDVVSPDGKFLFEGGAAEVGVSQIHADGTLTPVAGSPFPNGPFNNGGAPVFALATDPQGKFLLLADTEQSKITVFSIDPNTGALTNVSGSPFPVAPTPIGGGSPSTIVITH